MVNLLYVAAYVLEGKQSENIFAIFRVAEHSTRDVITKRDITDVTPVSEDT